MVMTIDGVRYVRLADVLQEARRLSGFTFEDAIRDENGEYVDPCDKAKIDAYGRLFFEVAGSEVAGDSKAETTTLLLELEREYYLRRYVVTTKDGDDRYYFRKMCAVALEARMKEEGKSEEEIHKALEDGEALPVFSSDRKLARVFDDHADAEYIKKRCEEEGMTVEIVPAIYIDSGRFQRYWLDTLLDEYKDDAK